MNTVLMEDLTAPVIRERSKAAVLFIPLGSIEQHGPHMPIDTDSLIAARISEAVARRIGGLVGPRMNYGCRSLPISGGGELFPGTISLRGATFSAVIADLVTAYADHGHPRIVILNGHYENTMFAIDGAKLARERGSDASVVLVDWWTVFEKATLDTIFEGEFPGWEAEHAGIVETSILMHVAPERVRADLIEQRVGTIPPPIYTVLPERPGLVDPSGVLRTAYGATPEIGKAMFETMVDRITAIVAREYQASDAGEDVPNALR